MKPIRDWPHCLTVFFSSDSSLTTSQRKDHLFSMTSLWALYSTYSASMKTDLIKAESKDLKSIMTSLLTQYSSLILKGTFSSENTETTKCLLSTSDLTQSSAFFSLIVTDFDFMPSGYWDSSIYGQVVTTQASAFFNHQATDLNFISSGYRHSSIYSHMVTSQASALFNHSVSKLASVHVSYQNS